MKNKEIGLQGHPAFKALDALSSQEQINYESAEVRPRNLLKHCSSFLNDARATPTMKRHKAESARSAAKILRFPRISLFLLGLFSQNLKLTVDFSVPKLEKGPVRGN